MGRNIGSLLGPLVGGVLVAAIGASGVLPSPRSRRCCRGDGRVGSGTSAVESARGEHGELRAGFAFVWHSPVLRGMTAAWMVLLFLLGPILVAELPLAHEFGQGAAGYGVIAACWAVRHRRIVPGRITTVRSESGTMNWGCVLIGAGFAVVAGAPMFAVAMLGMIVAGLSEGTVSVAEIT